MADCIYLIDPQTKNPLRVDPVSFHDIGIKERADLQQWIINHPDLLGEDLLIITTEFDRFDKSNKRLDLLALDVKGNLVIIELKLDAQGSLADQQAIRYAAFCSTMTMEDVLRLLAEQGKCSEDEALASISKHVDAEDLPDFAGEPRIILAAGSINDQELTASVLWLRKFGLDISCVELTPYSLAGNSHILIVPRVIIPVPEARDYQVRVEQKDGATIRRRQSEIDYHAWWKSVANAYAQFEADQQVSRVAKGMYQQLATGLPIKRSDMHYEWALRKSEGSMDVALHFEQTDKETNLRFMEAIKAHGSEIAGGIEYDFYAGPWGRKWAEVRFRIPCNGNSPSDEVAAEAARVMHEFVKRTKPILTAEFASLQETNAE